MPICVDVDVDGVIYNTLEVYPACSAFALTTAEQVGRLTYWADLAIALDPSEQAFWALVGAMVTAYGVVAGLRFVVRNMREENRQL